MNYQNRIREIHSAFVMGYHDLETCIAMFEELLHDYGLLPKEEQLDRTITNESFLSLLKQAKDHTINKQSPPQTSIVKSGDWRLSDPRQRCPVCQKPVNSLFNRVQSLDNQFMAVDPPRCQECMMKWVEERFGSTRPKVSEPNSLVDRSPASPLKPDELNFFAEYEKQMEPGIDERSHE